MIKKTQFRIQTDLQNNCDDNKKVQLKEERKERGEGRRMERRKDGWLERRIEG